MVSAQLHSCRCICVCMITQAAAAAQVRIHAENGCGYLAPMSLLLLLLLRGRITVRVTSEVPCFRYAAAVDAWELDRRS